MLPFYGIRFSDRTLEVRAEMAAPPMFIQGFFLNYETNAGFFFNINYYIRWN